MNAKQLREQLLEVLSGASEPMSTSHARLAITDYCRRRGRPVLAEEVYRALVVLARRGVVRRVADQPGRGAHWELTRRHLRRPATGWVTDEVPGEPTCAQVRRGGVGGAGVPSQGPLAVDRRPKGFVIMDDSRKFPWLGGLVAAITVAVLLIGVAVQGTVQVINDFATEVADTSYQP